MRNDCKHIALEKIRDTINLLRKSNLGSNSSQVCMCPLPLPLTIQWHPHLYLPSYLVPFHCTQKEDSLLNRLKSLQNSLRYDQRGKQYYQSHIHLFSIPLLMYTLLFLFYRSNRSCPRGWSFFGYLTSSVPCWSIQSSRPGCLTDLHKLQAVLWSARYLRWNTS